MSRWNGIIYIRQIRRSRPVIRTSDHDRDDEPLFEIIGREAHPETHKNTTPTCTGGRP